MFVAYEKLNQPLKSYYIVLADELWSYVRIDLRWQAYLKNTPLVV